MITIEDLVVLLNIVVPPAHKDTTVQVTANWLRKTISFSVYTRSLVMIDKGLKLPDVADYLHLRRN